MKFMLEPVSNNARQRTGRTLLFKILTHAVVNRSLDNALVEVVVSESPLSHLPVSVIDRSVVEDWRMEEDRIVLVAYHLDVLMELFLCLEVLSEAFGCPICSDR